MLFQIKTRPYVPIKWALEGPAGGGKSRTLAELSIGAWKESKSKLPVWWIDTEYKFQKTLAPLFAAAGVPVKLHLTRSFVEFITLFHQGNDGGTDVFCTDSITHIFQDLTESFSLDENAPKCPICRGLGKDSRGLLCARCGGRKRVPKRLGPAELGDRNRQWQMNFSDMLVVSPINVGFTGRVQTDFTTIEEEYTEGGEQKTKLTLAATGKKMQAGRDTAYEPDLLLWMEQKEKNVGMKGKQRITNQAVVLKDQSGVGLQGKIISLPSWKDIKPVWDYFQKANAGVEQPTELSLAGSDETQELQQRPAFQETPRSQGMGRNTLVDEIAENLVILYPSNGGDDKQGRAIVLNEIFGTPSLQKLQEASSLYPPSKLLEGLDILKGRVADFLAEQNKPEAPAKEPSTPAPKPSKPAASARPTERVVQREARAR